MAFGVRIDEATGKVLGTLNTSGTLPAGYVNADAVSAETRAQIVAGLVHLSGGAWLDLPTVAPRVLSRLDFARLFTQEERILIRARRAAGDQVAAVIDDFYALLELAGDVNLDHVDVVAGLDFMVAQGLLTSLRKTAILDNQPPA